MLLEGKTVIVTGVGAGLGRECAAAALREGASVVIDALVQVAAFEYVFGGLRDTNLDDWRKAFETNVLGALTVLRPVADAMKQSGGGAVVFIGSQATFKPNLPQAGYAASKGALLSAMYYLADELGADNIRCNMVVPSWLWGPPVQAFVEGKAKHKGISTEEVLHDIVGKFPLRRM